MDGSASITSMTPLESIRVTQEAWPLPFKGKERNQDSVIPFVKGIANQV
jgi:hypothetical protein